MLSKATIKYIQNLSQKKYRQQENLFIAEGTKIIKEALNSPIINVKKIFAVADWIHANKENKSKTEMVPVTQTELERLSQLETPHQVLGLIEMPQRNTFHFHSEKLMLALDGIQDPGNMGTILRIADWFGIKQMICSEDCADIYNSKVVQASMGSIFRTEVFYTSLPQWLQQHANVPVYGAALDGVPLQSCKKMERGILIIGNESKGIRSELTPYISKKITIEKTGETESLNAAVATGIILYQLKMAFEACGS
jgi:TrmH family RNA methyltransferase